jgi:hypothetical protein
MTAADARISTSLPTHPKTKKLIRRLGPSGGWALVCLFLWVASNRSDGNLSGMTDEDIELAADWGGAEGALIGELVNLRFLDGEAGTRAIHDWAEHNPWAAGAKMRSQKAQWNAAKRHHGIAEANRQVPEYAALRAAASTADSTSAAGEDGSGCMQSAEHSIAPSPSPSPSPTLDMGKTAGAVVADCPQQQIIDLYHRLLPMGRQVRDWTPARAASLRARWRDKPARQKLEWWERFFGYVAESDFLTGKVHTPGRKPFELSLDWLVKSENMAKVIEGAYENEREAA